MKPDHYQELALKTWYSPDDPRYPDPRHPLIKLAGEAGELLDLFGKDQYKPNFSWWNCRHCGYGDASHSSDNHKVCLYLSRVEDTNILRGKYTPLILDELGDYWYYLRIVCFIYGRPTEWIFGENYHFWDIDKLLATMAQNSAVMLNDWLDYKRIDGSRLKVIWGCLNPLLAKLDCTLDHLTELNFTKLNSEPTAHGWKANQ